MTTSQTPKSPTDDRSKPEPVGGPTAPAADGNAKREGPKTGGYDDHSPDRAPNNEKGGYGAG